MKNKCQDCYIEIKKYTYVRGIFLYLIATLLLMIPILNIYFLKEQGEAKAEKNFWEGCWYNIIKKNVKQYRRN